MPLGAFPFNTARSTPSIPSNPIFLSSRHAPPKQPLCDPRAMAALHHRKHPRYSIATAVCLPPVATSGHNGSTARRPAAGQGPCSSAPPRGTVLAGGQRRDVPAYLQTQCLVRRVLTPQSVSGVRIGDAAMQLLWRRKFVVLRRILVKAFVLLGKHIILGEGIWH